MADLFGTPNFHQFSSALLTDLQPHELLHNTEGPPYFSTAWATTHSVGQGPGIDRLGGIAASRLGMLPRACLTGRDASLVAGRWRGPGQCGWLARRLVPPVWVRTVARVGDRGCPPTGRWSVPPRGTACWAACRWRAGRRGSTLRFRPTVMARPPLRRIVAAATYASRRPGWCGPLRVLRRRDLRWVICGGIFFPEAGFSTGFPNGPATHPPRRQQFWWC